MEGCCCTYYLKFERNPPYETSKMLRNNFDFLTPRNSSCQNQMYAYNIDNSLGRSTSRKGLDTTSLLQLRSLTQHFLFTVFCMHHFTTLARKKQDIYLLVPGSRISLSGLSLARFKITADILMAFAGQFFTEEIQDTESL